MEQFGSIGGLTTDSRGRIYVLDEMTEEIRVFDWNGAYSHTIGKEGEGPGEFQGLRAIYIGRGDTLWAVDDGTARYSRFAPDGTLVDSYPRHIVGYLSSTSGAVLSDGSLVDWAPYFPDGRFGARVVYVPVRLVAGDSPRTDTLPSIEHVWPMLASGRMPETLYSGEIAAAVASDGSIWFAHTQDYRVYRRTLQGDTTLSFTLAVVPPPLGEPERDLIRRRWRRQADLRDEHLEALPETKPVILRIATDGAGHVFVFVDVAGEPAGSLVDVFQRNGRYLGRLFLPRPLAVPAIGDPVVHATPDYLYVVVKDELDVPYVSRLRIVKRD